MHKQSEKRSVWLEELASIKINAHEKRFERQPFEGLPNVHSKVRRGKEPVDIEKSLGRHLPIIHLISSEIVQLKQTENHNFYDYDPVKLTKPALAKNAGFLKEKRFTNKGIFGDIFDSNVKSKFGRPIESSIDPLKVDKAKDLLKPRTVESKPFEKQVVRDISCMETQMTSKLPSDIFSEEELRQKSVTSMKLYK